MQVVVVDSDCIIQFLRGNPHAVEFMKKVSNSESILKTTAFSVSELYFGAFISKQSAKNMRDVKDILEHFEILSFTQEAAILHAQIAADLKIRGKPIGVMDPFIASIVLAAGDAIATRNVDHFKEIERLMILNWDVPEGDEIQVTRDS